MPKQWLLEGVILFLMIAHHVKGQTEPELSYGFVDEAYTGEEGVLQVTVFKEGTNIDDFFLNVNLFTYPVFDIFFTLPPELPIAERPDAAEMGDFIVTPFSVIFPPGSETEEQVINITLVQDNLFEPLLQGFYAVLTTNELVNNPTDNSAAVADRNGVALINIQDIDILSVSFENSSFALAEEDAVLDDLVFVRRSSIPFEFDVISVLINVSTLTADRGIDFEFNGGVELELSFSQSDERLSVSLSTFADNVLEQDEDFALALSVPPLSRPFVLGDIPQAMFTITDNDPGVFGFERDNYTVSEANDSVVVCVAFSQPELVQFEDNTILLSVTSTGITAQGGGTDYNDLVVTGQFITSLMTCYTITIIDDSIDEETEEFNVTLSLVGNSLDITLDPATTLVFIEDDDAPSEITPPLPTDGPTTEGPTTAETVGPTTEIPTTTETVGPTTEIPTTTETVGPTTDGLTTPEPTTESPEPTTDGPTTPEPTTESPEPTTDGPTTPEPTTESPEPTTDGPTTPEPTTESPTTDSFATTADTTTGMMGAGMGLGGDPHFSVLLPTGQFLCYSIQGFHDFHFNLISNDWMQVNALFVQDSLRDEVTWIGALGIVAKGSKYKQMKDTKLAFMAQEQRVRIGDSVSLDARGVSKIHLSGGKLTVSDSESGGHHPAFIEVDVVLEDVGLEFTVRFVKGTHLDMLWKKVAKQSQNSHGLIGQFLRHGVEVDEARKLLQLPSPDMEPVTVMRKPVWHFMERETAEDQLCWVAMNPGYQGKRLIEGHYLDYLVDNIFSSDFTFKKSTRRK